MSCKYCDGIFNLPVTMLDVDAFGEEVEAYIDTYRSRLIIKKNDGELEIVINFCPICGEDV